MKTALAFALLAGLAGAAVAETADKSKPIQVNADRLDADEVKQTAVYAGNVRVTQGTMTITGARMELKEDPEGYRTVIVTVPAGELVTFRQRRDPKTPGIEEWIDGHGEKLVYDERADRVTLSTRAKLRRLENGEQRDETTGQEIVYDMRNARSSVDGAANGKPGSRVSTTIAPRRDTKPAAPASLAPAQQLTQPPKD
ncbi:MAG: lipopolysaccharide transport periplasmic protein LptA [Burkholderiaceae bacterium]